ncbi:mechanosensitive ion channel family protein [Viscerimonas tarda]
MLNTILLEFDSSTIDSLLRKIIPEAIILGERIILAIVVYFVGTWVISLLRNLVKRILLRKHIDGAVASFVNSLANTLLKVILVISIIGILGIDTTSFAALLAAAGLAVGMAMKDNLSNFAGGVMILLNKPFKLKDYIIAQGQEGNVTEIGILYTVLLTNDGRTIYLPNGPLSTGSIINNTDQKTRRVDITFNVNYGNDAGELKKILLNILTTTPLVLKTPEPFVGITAVKNGNIDITIRAWGLNKDYAALSVQLNEAVYHAMSEKGIFVASSLTVRMAKD